MERTIKHFLATVTAQDLVLTANRRLAVYLQKKYDQYQIDLGNSAWETLPIMPLVTWIESTWHQFSDDSRMQLSDFQEQVLWESIVTESPASQDLLNVSATARVAKDTWRLLIYWLVDLAEVDSRAEDIQVFKTWVKAFQQKCAAANCVTRATIFQLFVKTLQENNVFFPLPTKIYFIGFDEISPIIMHLQKTLQNLVAIENFQFSPKTAEPRRLHFLESQEELQAMARWAYKELKQHPEMTIGCVIPNLTEKRNQVIRIFQDVFYAEELHHHFPQPPFNISAANRLDQYSLIQMVFTILALNYSEVNLEDISALLRSPFIIGAESELNARAKLDARLRSFGEKKITLAHLTSSNLLDRTPVLQKCLAVITKILVPANQVMSVPSWCQIFVQQLSALGWPGDRSLNSTEFQLIERFKKLLDEFIALDKFVADLSFSDTLKMLQQLTKATLFQPKSADLPIQILGVLEASGIAFDHLWIAGLDNETWPAPASPNPFIPVEVQRRYEMPHSSSERELQFSLGVTKRFIQNADTIIFSHHEFDGDRPLKVSPLIENLPLTNYAVTPFYSIEKKIFATKKLEYFNDDMGPAITNTFVAGGSSIFQAQAACPFQAFAKFRLHARPLDDLQMGLAAHERGSIVHDILAHLWNKIKTHETLCSLEDSALNAIIVETVEIALAKARKKKPFTLKNGLLTLEKKRLQKLLFKWLAIEKLRQPFEVVSCEQQQVAHLGSLELQVQIDRIDRLLDGSHLIIDYKTGRPSLLDWFTQRPDEPQLPLYSVLSDQVISGVLFALVRLDEMSFRGLTAHNDIVPGAITIDRLKDHEFQNFTGLMEYWKTNLYQLADDFCHGNAQVSPKIPSTCQYCHFQELCRVNDRQSHHSRKKI
ncbi:MAG: PD-(D/E)XK nuclease family protein [Gammaproteobacteria bacterium]|nr:PD-(D/E)XK nuclease family protein [Gammaproteobacteria bacterium]